MIFNVIGLTNDLKAYDKHHTIFKNKKLESSRKICQKILPSIQKTTKKIVKESEANLAQWEKHLQATELEHQFEWQVLMSAPINNRERRNLEASLIALKKPSLNNKLETKLLHLFRNGVT